MSVMQQIEETDQWSHPSDSVNGFKVYVHLCTSLSNQLSTFIIHFQLCSFLIMLILLPSLFLPIMPSQLYVLMQKLKLIKMTIWIM